MAEHLTVNQVVAGSSPAGGAIRKRTPNRCPFFSLPLGARTNAKAYGSRFASAQVVWSIDFVLVKTHHSPYFVEKTLPKTILNCFRLRFPAGGATCMGL